MHLGPLILQTLIALCIFQALDIADVNHFFPFGLSELQIALLGKASMQKIMAKMGAEIGIATGKMHARGPVGVEQLTCFNYRVCGSGQIRPT